MSEPWELTDEEAALAISTKAGFMGDKITHQERWAAVATAAQRKLVKHVDSLLKSSNVMARFYLIPIADWQSLCKSVGLGEERKDESK